MDQLLKQVDQASYKWLESSDQRLWTMEQEALQAKGALTCQGIFQWAVKELSFENGLGACDWKSSVRVLLHLTKVYDKSEGINKEKYPMTTIFISAWKKHVPQETRETQSIGEYFATFHKVLSHQKQRLLVWTLCKKFTSDKPNRV